MRRILKRMTHWGAAIVVFSQAPVLAGEAAPLPMSESVVSVVEVLPLEEMKDKEGTEGIAAGMPVDKPRPLFQHTSYPAAWKASQKSNRPILVFISMPNCHYCVKMKEQVYQLPRVEQLVSSSFESVCAGRYTHARLIEKLHVKWYPTTVLVGPNNKILDVIEGYADANQFQQRLQTGLASLNKPEMTQTR